MSGLWSCNSKTRLVIRAGCDLAERRDIRRQRKEAWKRRAGPSGVEMGIEPPHGFVFSASKRIFFFMPLQVGILAWTAPGSSWGR